jgi:hypothetical protein
VIRIFVFEALFLGIFRLVLGGVDGDQSLTGERARRVAFGFGRMFS